jgi:hypothetical protein
MWVLADVVGLFSIKVGSFSRNVDQDHRIFSANVVPERRMLSGQTVYVLGPPHLTRFSVPLLPRPRYPKKIFQISPNRRFGVRPLTAAPVDNAPQRPLYLDYATMRSFQKRAILYQDWSFRIFKASAGSSYLHWPLAFSRSRTLPARRATVTASLSPSTPPAGAAPQGQSTRRNRRSGSSLNASKPKPR